MSANAYNNLKDYVNDHILDFMPEIDANAKDLYDAMVYSLTAGGKRFRAVLLLASYDLCGKNLLEALPYACACEYIHTYSLIHDDLPALDNDDLRRGKPTNHKMFGENLAILAGDGLLSAAYEIMSKDMLLYLDNQEALNRRARAVFSISKGTGVRGMVAGQVADVLSEDKHCSKEMLKYIHTNKTGAFIRACVKAGAYLGGADKVTTDKLDCYGENLGLAFQVVDDILDVISSKEELGHSIGKDADQNKCTYPALYGLDESISIAKSYLKTAKDAVSGYYDNAEALIYAVESLEKKING